ncbi:metallophosphoesterase family protein [Demequina maris]|uniref:metallophosphoesterase family protein n=1 Tax=Demequina maris TaxID=1638982 RepID=UPI0007864504|nr:metallophosphoesterase [Demequina maris]
MKVALLGDTHGRENWIVYALDRFAAEGLTTVIQVGDLGVWPGPTAARMWNRIDELLTHHGQTMMVAPGNHEDYDEIARLEARDDGWLRFRDHILLAPRGHRTEIAGRSLCWLGGAASVDRGWRLAHQQLTGQRTWWAGEAISDEDVQATIAGGPADIMVSHEAPQGVPSIEAAIQGNPHGFLPEDLAYAQEVRGRFTEAFTAVQPKLLLHGHYHRFVDEVATFEGFNTHVFGLSQDEDPRSLAMLELTSLKPAALPDRPRAR